MTQVVPFPAAQGEPDEPTRSAISTGSARGWVEKHATLPSPARIGQQARWWGTTGALGLGALFLKAPLLLLFELKPISVGLWRVLNHWSRWCAVAEYAEAAAKAEGNDRVKHQREVEQRKSGRRRLSLALVVVLIGVCWWAVYAYPTYLLVAGLALVGVFDAVGRAGTEKVEKLPPPMRTVLKEGVPLSQITAAVVETLAREGLEVGIANPMRYDAARSEYRLQISCLDLLEAKHLRAIERGIGADDYTVRNLATGTSTVRELVIRDGDPLAEYVERPWIDTGSTSVAQPQDLGVSMTEVPFALPFAGVHIKVVGASGSGKTKWLLRACIDRVSACHDAVIWGCDLTNGPELALWRGVIQRRAFTVEDTEALLDAALAEIDRRGKILAAFAEDDDETNDQDEWSSNLGPALVIFADEFSQTAEFDGKGGKPNLLGKAEQIVRTGRKHWVSLVMLTQKTGNSDFGSQTMTSQCAVSVMLACDPRDTVTMVGVERRDAGYAPHLLAPGVEGDPRDAGKAFLDSPAHRTADIYRAYAPGSTAEVKRRARQRLADGLPALDGHAVDEIEDVAEVPPVLAAVERAFADAGDPEWMSTADLLEAVREELPGLNANTLADGIPVDKNEPGSRRRVGGQGNPVRGYFLASIRKAMQQL